ncbi:hypothetical protein AGMMS50276_21480 [Synergistales bacterium]|nr:hypothetical protein AGMMS50276_21480 [Synergistales bacterium]
MSKPFTHVGVPIRDIKKIPKIDAARVLGFNVNRSDFVVGVIGGSIGSVPLENFIARLAENKKNFVFAVLGNPPSNLSSARLPCENLCFLGKHWDMTPFYSVSDVVICRAGASTLAELMAYDIPALVVPWMKAADGHQELNAQNFSRVTGNPIWIKEEIDKEIDEEIDKDYSEFDEAFEKLIEKFNGKFSGKNQNGKFNDSITTQADSLWRILC